MKKSLTAIFGAMVIFVLVLCIIKFAKTSNEINNKINLSGEISGEVSLEQSDEVVDNWLYDEEFMNEVTLISNEAKGRIGADFTTFEKEPISQKEDRGDGFHWIDYTYIDLKKLETRFCKR